MENVDLLIVGAGIAGICACKTYLQVYPDAKILVIDQNSTLGGTWSQQRLYEDLKTNNILPTAQYPDFPFDEATFDVDKNTFIRGEAVHRYLRAYAEEFGVYKRIRFNTSATKLEEMVSDGIQTWTLTTTGSTGVQTERRIHTPKIVIATGTTSRPFIPTFRNQSSFGKPVIHSKDFAQEQNTLKTAKSVVVLGGAKSAYDAVYSYASAGVSVDWIIRKDGRGPSAMSTSHVTPFKVWLEPLSSTRIMTWLVPCSWQDADGYSWPRWLLHQTRLGRAFLHALGSVMDQDMADKVGWAKHPETRKLMPRLPSLQTGTNLSIMNYPTDFLELVRSGIVRVHIDEIDHLSPGTVHLQGGETIETDLIFCATGWRYVPDFLDGLEQDLDLPRTLEVADPLVNKADEEILRQFPALQDLQFPKIPAQEVAGGRKEVCDVSQTRPLNLYRFIVPPRYFNSRSIVFLGHVLTIRTFTLAHLQSLWATAYLNGLLLEQDSVTQQEALWQATLHSQSVKLTQPASAGARIPDMVFQGLVYFDLLLKDLGLQRWRKGGMFKEIFSAYMPPDYRTVLDEWLQGPGKISRA